MDTNERQITVGSWAVDITTSLPRDASTDHDAMDALWRRLDDALPAAIEELLKTLGLSHLRAEVA